MSTSTLEGHNLLILSPFITESHVATIQSAYPSLKITTHYGDFRHHNPTDVVSEEEWKQVTILHTGHTLPAKEVALKLQLVQLQSAGANHVLKTPVFADTKIDFCTANGVHGPQIAEWVIGTYLAQQRSIPTFLEAQKEQKWSKLGEWPGDNVGRRVGILGYGAIGRQTARIAKAMGMDVHAYTLHPKDTPEARRDMSLTEPGLGDPEGLLPSKWFSGTSNEQLHAFLGSGLDLLLIAVPLTPNTTHLIGKEEFEILGKKKTFISNIARGAIMVQEELIKALNDGSIRGAALDVTDPEPLPDSHPLWSAKNVILTPHISGASTALGDRTLGVLMANLERLAQGRLYLNLVSREDGY